VSLEVGLTQTYAWIESQVRASLSLDPSEATGNEVMAATV